MPEKNPCIKQLSPDKRHWRIDWVGGVSRFDDSDSLKIVVYISPALSDPPGYGPSLYGSKVAWQQRQRVWLDLCWLPFLEIGSFWKDGYDQKLVTVKPANTNLYTQTPHQIIKLKDLKPLALIEGGKEEQLLYEDFFKGPFQDEIGESRLVAYTSRGKIYFVIPCIELIRRYYCFSVDGIHALFNGAYPDQLTKWTSLKEKYCESDTAVALCIEQKDRPNWPLIAFAQNHPETPRKGWSNVDRVHDSLIMQRVNHANASDVNTPFLQHPEAFFPIPAALNIMHFRHWLNHAPLPDSNSEPERFIFSFRIIENSLPRPDTSNIRVVSPQHLTSITHVTTEDIFGDPNRNHNHGTYPQPGEPRPPPGPREPTEPRNINNIELNMNPFDDGEPVTVEIESDRWDENEVLDTDLNNQPLDTPVVNPPYVDGDGNLIKSPTDIVTSPGFERKKAIEAGFDNLKLKIDELVNIFNAEWSYAKAPERFRANTEQYQSNVEQRDWGRKALTILRLPDIGSQVAIVLQIRVSRQDKQDYYFYLVEIDAPPHTFVTHLFSGIQSFACELTEQQIGKALDVLVDRKATQFTKDKKLGYEMYDISGIRFRSMMHTQANPRTWCHNFFGKFYLDKNAQTLFIKR